MQIKNKIKKIIIKKNKKVRKRETAPVAQWLARRTVGRKVWGSNPIRVMWDFSSESCGSAMGPLGKLEPHSRASSTPRMRL